MSKWCASCPLCPRVFVGDTTEAIRDVVLHAIAEHATATPETLPPFGATVTDYGGDRVVLVVDGDTVSYPSVGERVYVAREGEAVVLIGTYMELWRAWQMLIEAMDVLLDRETGRAAAAEVALARIITGTARAMLPHPNPGEYVVEYGRGGTDRRRGEREHS